MRPVFGNDATGGGADWSVHVFLFPSAPSVIAISDFAPAQTKGQDSLIMDQESSSELHGIVTAEQAAVDSLLASTNPTSFLRLH